MRAPLWQQRKRAADLLAVASRYSSFPILLETYRECVRDVFDLPRCRGDSAARFSGARSASHASNPTKPSPFASALLFSYIANYIYEGDAPLAERRAQALSIDQSQLEEILGSTDFRELLDTAALDEVEAQLQALDPDYQARHADGAARSAAEARRFVRRRKSRRAALHRRSRPPSRNSSTARRAVRVRIAGETRFIPVEYAGRYRDALGMPLPPGLAEVFLEQAGDPLRGNNSPLCAHARPFHHRRCRRALSDLQRPDDRSGAAHSALSRQTAGRRVSP